MATKRAAAEANNERPSRRQRLEQEASDNTVSLSLDGINSDCILLIMQHLPAEDLNSIAICSRRYRNGQSHASLDQTRTGTIVCSERSTVQSLSILDASARQGWNQVFTGNRTRLKIVGLERIPSFGDHMVYNRWLNHMFPGVTSLDMSCYPLNVIRNVSFYNVWAFIITLPNLEEVDLSGVRVLYHDINTVVTGCNKLRRVNWNGSQQQVNMEGRVSNALTELYIDNSRLVNRSLQSEATDAYLFMNWHHLERLSIKDVSWSWHGDNPLPLTQETLIKMVRRHPFLRWLRSDLSAENIAMLQRERPEITFVRE